MKKNSRIFSVLINNYNYASFLKEAIESVLWQTFQDFELIIVDDGSTDNSREIINSYTDERILKVFKENGGQASAFNAGFEKTTGKYVAFLDSDDIFDEDKLERVYEIFQRHDYAAVQHRLTQIDAYGNSLGKLHPGGILIGDHDLLKKYFDLNRTNLYSATSGIVVPRRLLKNIFPIPEKEWRICADVPLFRPLALMGNIYTMNEPAGKYRIHGDNGWMNTQEQSESFLRMLLRSNECVNKFLKTWGVDRRVELPVPHDNIERYNVKSVAVYGAGAHTRRLIAEGLTNRMSVSCILDDNPQVKDIESIPVIKTENYTSAENEAVLVSSDIHEPAMAAGCIRYRFPMVLSMYHYKQFTPEKNPAVSKVISKLKRDKIKKIALYGAGFHTLNLLQSGMLAGFDIICILDDSNYGWSMNGVAVHNPEAVCSEEFDAVVLSSDIHERSMFYKAIQHGLPNIYSIYGPHKAPRANYADYRDMRNAFYDQVVPKASLYGLTYYNSCLLQSEAISEYVDLKYIVDIKQQNINSLNGVKIVSPEMLPPDADIGKLIVPPLESAYKDFAELDFELLNKEDCLIVRQNVDEINVIYNFFNKAKVTEGVMLDVGAHMGSSLKSFAETGWKVYAFEPEPVMRRHLERACTDYKKVDIKALALSDREQERMPIYKSDVSSGITTLSPFHESHKLAAYVEVSTLGIFASNENVQSVDLLKIDTEGYDLFVLKGNNWEKLKPRVIMCEFENRKTEKLDYSFYDMADYLKEKGYHLVISEWEPVFEYGMQPRWRCYKKYPCELDDPEAYGNILAFRYEKDLRNAGIIEFS